MTAAPPRRAGRTRPLATLAAAAALALGALAAAGPGGLPAASAARAKALLRRTPALDRIIASGRLQVLEEYGPAGLLLLVRGAEAALEEAESAAGGAPGRRRVPDSLHLRSRTIDSSRPRLSAPPGARTGGRLEVIQFHGPVKRAWLEALRGRGRARPVAYLPHNGYLVWVEDPAALSSTRIPLQWREPLASDDRVSPVVRSSPGPIDVTVQVVRGGDHDAVLDEIRSRALAVRMEARDLGEVTNIRVTLPAGAAEELASLPEVAWVEPFEPVVTHDERSALVTAGLVSPSRPLGPGYLSWLAAHGMSDLGGAPIDVTDTGIDTGGTSVQHPGLTGRVAYAEDLTSEGVLDDCVGHGTNIAGIIAGGPGPGFAARDADGYLLGLGIAPSARLGVTRIFDCAGRFVPAVPFTDLVAGAYERGARIGNNSWGGVGTQYNTVTAEYDALVRDANRDPSDGDQGFLPVFSSGNLGPNPLTIGWPATAKNVLSVGATENFRPNVTDGCGAAGLLADNVNHVLSISGRGPTADGRVKPDLVAPGSHVQSLASTSVEYTGAGVCDAYFPPGQRLLSWSTGTSQAAAHVTGAAAIASEVYRRQFGALPSPAMIKAMLINHAHDLGTSILAPSNTTNRPNFQQGWGRAEIGRLLEARARVAFDQQQPLTGTGDSAVFGTMVVEDPNWPVVVTLAWTDAPGTPGGWAWVNDLDLAVEAGGATYLGNVLDRGLSIEGGQPDFRNNVEIVVVPSGARSLRVMIEAANLAGDGIPSLPGETDQDYALYLSNARLATRAGLIDFVEPQAICGRPASLRLADLTLRGLGRVSATVESGGDRETVRLDEDPAGAGVFAGALDVSGGPAVPGDGVLQSADGRQVRASYLRPDPETGAVLERAAAVSASCLPPAISQVRVARVGDGEATVSWSTDRPASSVVAYGPGSNRSNLRSEPLLVTDHEVRLTGLSSCVTYTATVSSTDTAGLTSSGPATPLRFSTGAGPKGRRILFADDMEALGSRWSHAALSAGSADDWQLGFPAFGPPGPFSGTKVWGTDLGGNYSEGADAALVSPPLDLRDRLDPQLSFMHYYALVGGHPPDSRDDGAWVEVSADGGATWTPIDPAGGYPDTIDEDNPYVPGGSGVYAGAAGGWVKAVFDLSSFSEQVIRIRFRIWQDKAEARPTGAGWYIDDVEVTTQGSCREASIAIDGDLYGCSSRATLLLADSDLNASSTGADTARVTASSPAGSMEVVLTETGTSTGQFRAHLDLSPSAAAGKLTVAEGAPISFVYADLDSGGGVPATVTASALVSDCAAPPAPAGVAVTPDGAGRLIVSWIPVNEGVAADLQGYRIYYDTDGSGPAYAGTGALQGSSPLRVEAAPASLGLTSLAGCSPHFVVVTAFDRLGNESPFSAESFAVAPGPQPCAAGRLTASPASPGCRESLNVTVTDSNADPDRTAPGAVTVSASSSSQGGPVSVSLTETAPASGVFTGSLALSPAPQPGALAVSEGDVVQIQYADADDGRGQPRIATLSATVGDCSPPAISDLRVTNRSGDRAVVRWRTDEPATSTVRYGLDPSLGQTASISALATEHAVPIAGFSACSAVFYSVSSSDARSNTSTVPGTGPALHFGTYRDVAIFRDDFESGAPGWNHQGLAGGGDEWELGAPAPGVPGGPDPNTSSGSVWGTDLDGPYENGADMVLVSPSFDLTSAEAATLTFRHCYDIHSLGHPTGFDDGGFVEASIDGGTSWSYIVPVGGYPDIVADNPYAPFPAGAYANPDPDGRPCAWSNAAFVLDDFVGHEVRLRFHLLEDPIELSPASHAGWYLDDVTMTVASACHDALLELDQAEYDCNESVARIRLFDVDLDADPQVADTATVTVSSAAEPSGEAIALTESGPSTGLFEATLPISSADAPGTLRVGQDDTILARYDDADDGTGAGRPVTATARVPDCAPPTLSGVGVADVGPDSFRVEWITSEPGDSRLFFGASPALGGEVVVPGLRMSHAVAVSGLPSCVAQFFTVGSTDARGNLVREDASAGVRSLVTTAPVDLLLEEFDSGAPGWTHTGRGDTWQIGSGGGAGAAATATALGENYARPPDGVNSNFVLVSPPINVASLGRPALTFLHTYDFPTSFQGDDGGWVEAWDGSAWASLTPEGGYPAFLDPEAGRTGDRLPGYAGRSAGLAAARFDLSPVVARLVSAGSPPVTRLRFHVFVEGGAGPTGQGWRLEEVRVSGDLPCRAGRLEFTRASFACSAAAAALTLHDRDLDLDPASADAAAVTLESSGGPAPLQVTLLETGASTGLFRGEAPLSPSGIPGTLRAAAGDRITATYQDADDGSGAGALVSAGADVGPCSGPSITRPSISPAGGDGFIARWVTDRPATSEVVLQPPAGPALSASDHRLTTSHHVLLRGAAPCTLYTATLASEDLDGLRGSAGGPAAGLEGESVRSQRLFFDDMEGPDPGWSISGRNVEWERGAPQFGPPGAFSGQKVFGTDLTGHYDAAANATLSSPPIDLAGVSSARLTFWHWYDIFADTPPNSTDDSAWVEVQPAGGSPIYVQPIGGYPDTTDAEGGEPLLEGTAVYAGQSSDWEKATFDLTPFAGKVVTVRFRLWNDSIELLINGRTGAGWYLDDLEVSAPRFCFPAPAISTVSLPGLLQGESTTGVTISGTGFRPGATASFGPGAAVSRASVVSSSEIMLDIATDPRAVPGPRDLTIVNLDGQAATLAAAVEVRFNPARADMDGSKRVDGGDLLLMARAFGAAEGEPRYLPAADLNGDGLVDGLDLALLAARFGASF